MPRSHARAGTSRLRDPHTRTRYAHDALYDERIHAIRRFRQGFHQGQGHDDDAVRVVCVYVYTCMYVLETRRAHMVDMRPRARAMMMSSRDVASMATTGIAIGARCARACVDAREAREMPRARWHIVADVLFHSRVRRAVVRCRVSWSSFDRRD